MKKTSVYIPSVLIPMLINVIYLLLNTNYLSAAEYGIYSINLNTINLLYSVLLSFIQTASFRFYSLKNEIKNDETYLSTYVLSNLIFSIFSGIILILIGLVVKELNILMIWLSILTNGLYQFYITLFRLENNFKTYSIARISTDSIKILFYLFFIYVTSHVNHLHPIISMYGAYILLVVIETFRRRKQISIKYFSMELLKTSFKYAYPLIGTSIMNILFTSSDQYLILYFFNEESVGLYSFGYRIADTILVNLSMIILLVMYPILMDKYDNVSKKVAEIDLKKMINFNFWIIIPISCWLYNYMGILINLFFPNFIQAEKIAQSIIIVSFFHSLSMFTCKGLELGRNTKKLLVNLSIALVINILYNLVFLPIYGTIAAAHGSIVSYVIYNFILVIDSRKYLEIKFDRLFILKVLVITIISLLVPYAVTNSIELSILFEMIFSLLFSIIIYLIFSYKFNLIKYFN